jgi:hypothetical protein
MADHFEDDPAAQLRREIKDEIYRDAGFSPAAQAAAMRAAAQLVEADRQAATDQQRRSEVEADEEERRRAGRGGGGNPANASHSLNIRPDVVEGPAGLEVRTAMKSADYRANAGLEADLAEAKRSAREEQQDPLRARSAEAEPSAHQPTLTLEAIERDPWNAVELSLPPNADAALLQAARSAAEYCADGEHELMLAAREGRYTPPGWTGAEGEPDAHEYNEAKWLQADKRLGLINEQIDRLEGRGVYAEASLAPDAPPLSDTERAEHLETLRAYDPAASVYDVLETQLYESGENGTPRSVDAALCALLGNDYAWPQTFGEVLEHIDRGYTVADSWTVDLSQDAGGLDPGDEPLSSDQLLQRTNEDSVKREDAQRPARSAEDVAGEPASPATPSLADDLRAAEKAAKAEAVEADEEERRRAGRGGGGNPANASHSLNIRPDVVEGPAGMEVRTTMKSADYPANPDLKADLAEAERSAREERQEPLRQQVAHRDAATNDDGPPRPKDGLEADLSTAAAHGLDDDAQHVQVIQRANEESTKRQEAERAARSGEPVPGDPASSATPSLAADLRAAEKAAKVEREAEGHELVTQDHGEGKTPGGGGRGIF